jgi:chromosome segregation ATPase
MKLKLSKEDQATLVACQQRIEKALGVIGPIREQLGKLEAQATELPGLIAQKERSADAFDDGAIDEIAKLKAKLSVTERCVSETQARLDAAIEAVAAASLIDLFSFGQEALRELEEKLKAYLLKVCDPNTAHSIVRNTTAYSSALHFLKFDPRERVDKEAAAREALRCIGLLLADDVPGFNVL